MPSLAASLFPDQSLKKKKFVITSYSIHYTKLYEGDLNLADVEWVVQFRIDNPYNYLFKVRNPEVTLRDISESAMREIVGDRTVNEVLTVGKAEITNKSHELIQKICDEYSLGVKIDQISYNFV